MDVQSGLILTASHIMEIYVWNSTFQSCTVFNLLNEQKNTQRIKYVWSFPKANERKEDNFSFKMCLFLLYYSCLAWSVFSSFFDFDAQRGLSFIFNAFQPWSNFLRQWGKCMLSVKLLANSLKAWKMYIFNIAHQ